MVRSHRHREALTAFTSWKFHHTFPFKVVSSSAVGSHVGNIRRVGDELTDPFRNYVLMRSSKSVVATSGSTFFLTLSVRAAQPSPSGCANVQVRSISIQPAFRN